MKSNWIIILTIVVFGVSCGGNQSSEGMQGIKKDGKLLITSGQDTLLAYQYETVYPPEGVDTLFKRSGFIHPLKTPSGKVLTRIQPEDHYHHYGVWNPWTHTLFEGDTLDFWNLYKNEGTVRFAGFESIDQTDSEVSFKVLHEHVVLKDGKNKVALNEVQTISIHDAGKDQYIIDFRFDYTPATESPFKLLEYRYGGFGWRATGEWDNQNSSVLTSDGKTRKDADGSLATWAIVQGILGDGSGGAVLMSNPSNETHPEPLRVWPEDTYERGDMFLCMFPTKFADWTLEPGNTYTLRYRMIIFDGEYTADMAERSFVEYSKGE